MFPHPDTPRLTDPRNTLTPSPRRTSPVYESRYATGFPDSSSSQLVVLQCSPALFDLRPARKRHTTFVGHVSHGQHGETKALPIPPNVARKTPDTYAITLPGAIH